MNLDRDVFDAEAGLGLIQRDRFDEAAIYFEKHLAGNALAHYGLALAKFRRDPRNLTAGQTRQIVSLFEEAISLSPDFPDAHFMCGMACNMLAGFQLGGFAKDWATLSEDGLRAADANLVKAEQYFHRAISLDPDFTDLASEELKTSEAFRDSAENLRKLL